MRPALSWPLSRRCRMSGRTLLVGVSAASATVAFSQASVAMRRALVLAQPFSRGDEIGERLRQLGDQSLARGDGQIVTRQHQLAHGGEMAVALDDAVERERRDVGIVVLSSARQDSAVPTSAIAAATARGSAARLAIADCTAGVPVATASTRSASTNSGESSSTGAAMSGLVGGEREHDRRRRDSGSPRARRRARGAPAARDRRAA